MTNTAELRRNAEGLGAALPPLVVAAAHLAQSALPGAHGRRRNGQGAEFWQFAPAAQSGGRIDWRRSARTDELFVRQQEWQAARQVMLWVDPGAAMRFSGDRSRPSKSERARLLAMALALVLLRGGERVGVADGETAPRSGLAQAGALAEALAGEAADQEHGTADLARLPAAGHAVLFSDFFGPLGALEAALEAAAARQIGGILVQMLDPAEESFPFSGRTRFESLSGHLHWETLRARDLKTAYLERLAERKDRLTALARHAGWQFTTLHSDAPPAAGLLWLYHALGASGGRL